MIHFSSIIFVSLIFQGLADVHASKVPNRTSSEPTVSLNSISTLGRLWSTTGDLENDYKKTEPKKCVKFGNAVHIVLIPTRQEFTGAGIYILLDFYFPFV